MAVLREGGEAALRLQTAVRTELSQNFSDSLPDDADSILQEYVQVLIINQKSKVEIANELNPFLQGATGRFCDWLWETLPTLGILAPPVDEPPPPKPTRARANRKAAPTPHGHSTITTNNHRRPTPIPTSSSQQAASVGTSHPVVVEPVVVEHPHPVVVPPAVTAVTCGPVDSFSSRAVDVGDETSSAGKADTVFTITMKCTAKDLGIDVARDTVDPDAIPVTLMPGHEPPAKRIRRSPMMGVSQMMGPPHPLWGRPLFPNSWAAAAKARRRTIPPAAVAAVPTPSRPRSAEEDLQRRLDSALPEGKRGGRFPNKQWVAPDTIPTPRLLSDLTT